MKHDHFVKQLADDRVLQAIAAAQSRSTAQVGLVISRRSTRDPIAAARRHHRILNLDRAPHHNGVLIFISPRSHNFSIYVGAGTLAAIRQAFWDRLSNELAKGFKERHFTDALTDVIRQIGDRLAEKFPKSHG